MNHTLGDLVDRLSICNIKLWFTQDEVFKAAKNGTSLPAENARRMISLNAERNKLITAIDEALDNAAREGRAEITDRPKIG